MKKIITFLLIAFSISIFAQQNTDTIQKVKLFQQPYNGKNGAVAWLSVGAGAMIIGGACQYLSTNPNIGENYLFSDKTITSAKTQNAFNFTFGMGVGIAAVSVVMATYDFGYYIKNVKTSKHTTLNLKASPTSVGLCLNFK
jgi:hypothetical protein